MNKRNSLETFFSQRRLDIVISSVEDRYPLQRFHLELGNKVKLSDLMKLSKDIGLAIKSVSPPIIVPEYKTGTVKLEVMLDQHPVVDFHTILPKASLGDHDLPLVLGVKNVSEPLVLDLQNAPHLLIGGTTGSGKSMLLHSAILTLLSLPKNQNIDLILMDPKHVEFSSYTKVSNVKVLSDKMDYQKCLDGLLELMEDRLRHLKKKNCRDIRELRQEKGPKSMSYIVVVIDEMADIIATCGKSWLAKLIHLTQKSRAAGIHIVSATQHPSSKVVPGELKANFPVRIGCKVASIAHSRVLFDEAGAEKLLGHGDALISGGYYDMQRFKGTLVNIDLANQSIKNTLPIWKRVFK